MVVAELALPDPLPKGYEIGAYVIDAELSPSMFGRMYRATDSKLRVEVAVNVLSIELRDDPGRGRFERAVAKASLAGRPVYEFGVWLGVPYVAVGYTTSDGALVDLSES